MISSQSFDHQWDIGNVDHRNIKQTPQPHTTLYNTPTSLYTTSNNMKGTLRPWLLIDRLVTPTQSTTNGHSDITMQIRWRFDGHNAMTAMNAMTMAIWATFWNDYKKTINQTMQHNHQQLTQYWLFTVAIPDEQKNMSVPPLNSMVEVHCWCGEGFHSHQVKLNHLVHVHRGIGNWPCARRAWWWWWFLQ